MMAISNSWVGVYFWFALLTIWNLNKEASKQKNIDTIKNYNFINVKANKGNWGGGVILTEDPVQNWLDYDSLFFCRNFSKRIFFSASVNIVGKRTK